MSSMHLLYPINEIERINTQEYQIEGRHVIVLLFIKPYDIGGDTYIKQFNYWHQKSDDYCSMYLIGYSSEYNPLYLDAEPVKGANNQTWYYSDRCFIDACNELRKKLKNWKYSGEPEMIILQNKSPEKTMNNLDFRNYYYIDINYGIKEEYIDSFPRFMENLLDACMQEVTAEEALAAADRKRIKTRNVLEFAIESCQKLPKPVKQIMKDRVFIRTSRSSN